MALLDWLALFLALGIYVNAMLWTYVLHIELDAWKRRAHAIGSAAEDKSMLQSRRPAPHPLALSSPVAPRSPRPARLGGSQSGRTRTEAPEIPPFFCYASPGRG